MAKIWTDGYVSFETEEEARENAIEEMTWDDIEEHVYNNMNFHDFFTKVRENMPNFFEVFENEWYEAKNDYFNRNYWEEEEDNED
jgi:hypothetical protein